MYQDEQMDQQKDKTMSLEDSNYMQYHNEQTDRQTRLRNPCHRKILTYSLYSSEQIDAQTDRQTNPCHGKILTDSMFPSEYTDKTTDRWTNRQTAGLDFHMR